MLVSVIITTFGNPIFLKTCIKSVLNQTYQNIELIVVDDNDPISENRRKTEAIVSQFKLHYIKHKKNENGAVARNTGIEVANGKFIAFLDSDDEYYKERIEICVKEMSNAKSKYAGVYTGCEIRKNGRCQKIISNVKTGNFIKETLACKFMFCSGSNLFILSSILKELKGFDTSFARHQDYELLVRIFKNYDLIGVNRVLLVKNNENFNRPSVEKMHKIKIHYLSKYEKIINGMAEKDKNYIKKCNYYELAEHSLRSMKLKKADYFYEKARSYGKFSIKEKVRRLYFRFLSI